MFDKINSLFSACTIEDDRDMLVMQTIANQIVQRRETWGGGYTDTPITDYCLGLSIDEIHAALPLTMVAENISKRALTVTQTIQSVNRLDTLYNYVCNPDEYEVIHLSKQLMHELKQLHERETHEQNLTRFFKLMQGFRPQAL